MQLPIVQSAPTIPELTDWLVLNNKTMANITRCILDSADKSNLSRFFSEADWEVEAINKERIAYLAKR